jgi:hypothetical protein
MQVCLIPLMGPFHLRYPSYNSVTVRDMVQASKPDVLAITALAKDAFTNPSWQDTEEIALPLSVIPWAKRQNLPLYLAHEPSPDPKAQADFERFAREYPQLGQKLSQANALLRPLNSLLAETLSPKRIMNEVLPLLGDYQSKREELLEDGPATDWEHARAKIMAERILSLKAERITVLASIDHLPFLEIELVDEVKFIELPEVEASDESRERSLLDFAFRTDVPEPGNLIAKLRTLNSPEARYHEANLLLANSHVHEALEVLEKASQLDFQEPYYMPGFLLSRLGQVYDLLENRKAAIRSYKGVLALTYATLEALEAAKTGLEKPFGEELPSTQ